MPWNKIGKYAITLFSGGLIGAAAPEAAQEITFDPELQKAIAALITAIALWIAYRAKSPKGE